MYFPRVFAANVPVGRVRALHTSRRVLLVTRTKGQAPNAARDPEEDTVLEQNPHLKHAKSSQVGQEGRDMGKGNAAPEPELPSHKFDSSSGQTSSPGAKGSRENGKRKLHTSALLRDEAGKGKGSGAGTEHTAESYFKEVDESPPASDKTFRVDGTSEATHRPHQQWADPQKEYATVSKDEPYEAPVETNNGEKPEQKDQKMGYGNTKREASRNVPKADEGPQAKDAGGLKSGSPVQP
ncbi:hypothetical protein ACEPAI_5578 [Sanghuangporus weigelae]